MGFKVSDITPSSFSTITPAPKVVLAKVFQVTRSDTTAVAKAMLPAGASILDFEIAGVASDAGTSATIGLGSTSAATEYVAGQDIKGAGTYIRPTITGTNVIQTEGLPQGNDISIFAKYTEAGIASTVGGPWKVVVTYVL